MCHYLAKKKRKCAKADSETGAHDREGEESAIGEVGCGHDVISGLAVGGHVLLLARGNSGFDITMREENTNARNTGLTVLQ